MCRECAVLRGISIHAPRTGSDTVAGCCLCRWKYFNPRSPHGERLFAQDVEFLDSAFQSTLPARGATERKLREVGRQGFQSTLPARGATSTISTGLLPIAFQSTLPARGATNMVYPLTFTQSISIHAPRTGSDQRTTAQSGDAGNFNPRSPHGERLGQPVREPKRKISIHAPRTGSDGFQRVYNIVNLAFQSTLPARGATRAMDMGLFEIKISIHAPRTGSDNSFDKKDGVTCDFNPRSPHGERRRARGTQVAEMAISIHAPRTGSDPAQTRIRSGI